MAKGGTLQKLYRSRKECIIAGISGGLGEYFNVDPIIFRVLFVVLTFVNGIGVFIYLLFWITVPRLHEEVRLDTLHIHTTIKEKMDGMDSHFRKGKNSLHAKGGGQVLFAFALIVVGIVALTSSVFSLHGIRFDIIWPAIVISIGLYFIFREEH